jgi:hypothetical protein
MTNLCLADEEVLAVHHGEASPGITRHANECLACARRLALLRGDLERIDEILALPPSRMEPRRLVLRLPLAAAAAAVVLLVGGVWWRGESRGPVRSTNGEEAIFLDDLSALLSPPAGYGIGDAYVNAPQAPSAIDVALGGRSTCGVDEPFLGVGCDDTRIAALTR